jgi:hypothetical protein
MMLWLIKITNRKQLFALEQLCERYSRKLEKDKESEINLFVCGYCSIPANTAFNLFGVFSHYYIIIHDHKFDLPSNGHFKKYFREPPIDLSLSRIHKPIYNDGLIIGYKNLNNLTHDQLISHFI